MAGKRNQFQHYVPQFLLKNFTIRNEKRLHVFDKSTGKDFFAVIRSIAAEKGIYDFRLKEFDATVEPSLCSIEGACAGIVKKILENKSIGGITSEERQTLSTFIAIQFYRTVCFREYIQNSSKKIESFIQNMGADPNNVQGFRPLTPESLRLMFMKLLMEAPKQTPLFSRKSWLLYSTTIPLFYISDNPVVMENRINPPRGLPFTGNGLMVPGIKVYFPLSNDICLAMLCPTIEDDIRKRASEKKAQEKSKFLEGIDTGSAITISNGEVHYINSLQVRYAERFIYSGDGNFTLARELSP